MNPMTYFIELFVEGFATENTPIIVDVSKVASHLRALDKAKKTWKLGNFITE